MCQPSGVRALVDGSVVLQLVKDSVFMSPRIILMNYFYMKGGIRTRLFESEVHASVLFYLTCCLRSQSVYSLRFW